jgi:catechol 2,3-dioxygenase-like lactoylglutathione lyase family enzyme
VPHLRVTHVTVDCLDPRTVASFWAQVLGMEVHPESDDDSAAVGGPSRPAGSPSWLFLRVPEAKTAKNRMHVDLEAGDLTAEVDRLVALGAAHLHDHEEDGTRWSVLQDPEGNEFCVVQRRAGRTELDPGE